MTFCHNSDLLKHTFLWCGGNWHLITHLITLKNNNINKKYYSNDQQIKIRTFNVTYLDHKFRGLHSDETLQKFKEKVLNNKKDNKETGQNLHIEKLKSFLLLRIYSVETQISGVKYSRVCDRSSWCSWRKAQIKTQSRIVDKIALTYFSYDILGCLDITGNIKLIFVIKISQKIIIIIIMKEEEK